jgi:hypothetical protein
MSNPLKAAKLAAVAAQVTTIGRARAALGKCTELLQVAYAKVNDASLWDEDELKDACRDRLDVVNAYAQGIYAMIGTDDPDLQEEEISALNASRVGLVIAQTDEACEDIDEAINENTFDVAATVEEGLRLAGEMAGNAIKRALNGAAAAGASFVFQTWYWWLIGGAAVGVYFLVRSRGIGAGGGA